MRIAIDARAFGWTGIGRYTRNLLQQYAFQKTSHEFIVMVPDGRQAEFAKAMNMTTQTHGTPQRCTMGGFEVVGVEGSYYSWREQIYFWRQLERLKADLFHFTHFNVPLLFGRPYVMTVHDTTRFVFPGERRQRLLEQLAYEFVFAQAVKKAKGIICVSQATKDDLLALPLPMSVEPQVIHEGVSQDFFQEVPPLLRQKVRLKLGSQDPYLLYVGVWMNHKNLLRLLSAFAEVREAYPRLKLVMTGKPVPAYSGVLPRAEALGLREHVIFPGFVEHHLLPALYAEAACFVFPSLYEGFGLPPLEAAACGVPVVASHVSSLPEVMGEAAAYVNPEDETDIARGIIRVLADSQYRQELVARGRQQARQFSWQTCADKTLELYEKVG